MDDGRIIPGSKPLFQRRNITLILPDTADLKLGRERTWALTIMP